MSQIAEEEDNTDVALVVGPPLSDASSGAIGIFVLFLLVLLLATGGCLWALIGCCRFVFETGVWLVRLSCVEFLFFFR